MHFSKEYIQMANKNKERSSTSLVMRYNEIRLHILRWLEPKRYTLTGVRIDVQKLELSYAIGRNVKWHSCFGKQFGSTSKC